MSLSSIKHNLLMVLTNGPSYGLKIYDDVKARPLSRWARFWLSHGHVYYHLRSLEWDGLVESYMGVTIVAERGNMPRRMFRLSEEGWSYLGYDRPEPPPTHTVQGAPTPMPVHYWGRTQEGVVGIICGDKPLSLFDRDREKDKPSEHADNATRNPDLVTCAGCRYLLYPRLVRATSERSKLQ